MFHEGLAWVLITQDRWSLPYQHPAELWHVQADEKVFDSYAFAAIARE